MVVYESYTILGIDQLITLLVLIYVSMVFFHEFGHYIFLKLLSKSNPKIYFYFQDKRMYIHTGIQEDYKDLTAEEKIKVYFAGIVGGFIPLLLTSFIITGLAWLLLPAYILGIMSDVEKIWRFRE